MNLYTMNIPFYKILTSSSTASHVKTEFPREPGPFAPLYSILKEACWLNELQQMQAPEDLLVTAIPALLSPPFLPYHQYCT